MKMIFPIIAFVFSVLTLAFVVWSWHKAQSVTSHSPGVYGNSITADAPGHDITVSDGITFYSSPVNPIIRDNTITINGPYEVVKNSDGSITVGPPQDHQR